MMITTKLYQDQNNEMTAVVVEDGRYSNYILCPEVASLEAESFLEEARQGFPDAPLYEYDSMVDMTMEEAAAREERESTLIAQIDDKVMLYPRRMSEDHQEFFQIELGDNVWQELLERASDNAAVEL